MARLKALVVDDSALYRKILTEVLSEFSDVEVLGFAHNGKTAIEKVKAMRPDFITLDFEMPDMDGIETLNNLKKLPFDVKVVMISSKTREGATVTLEALSRGAFDFITKPEARNFDESKNTLRTNLKPVINTISIKCRLKEGRFLEKQSFRIPTREKFTAPEPVTDIAQKMRNLIASSRIDIVTLGISTGGPNALNEVIPKLPANFRVPLVMVQHMPPIFTKALAESLNKKSAVTVVEGETGMPLKPATVYIAPGGRQMRVEKGDNGTKFIKITDAPPENNCRPAADYLFRSVAQCYHSAALGVIMTGMGADGTKGLIIMKKLGCKVIAQDEKTSTVFGMPMEAIKAGVVDVVSPLDKIAEAITSSVSAF